MQDIIKELRSALELQHAIQGTLVPLGSSDVPEAPVVAHEASTDKDTADKATVVIAPPADANPAPVSSAPVAVDQAPDASITEKPTVVIAGNAEKQTVPAPSDAPTVVKTQTPPATEHPSNADLFGNKTDPTRDSSLPPAERIAALIPADSPLHAMQTMEEVAAYVSSTVLIPLDAKRINPVFGVGNPTSDLLVIGEAPGADEDKQGEPFVGRAGQLLNKILGAINFAREDVYIANILKSRPPNNRDPQPDEIAAHIPILYKQITLIKPRLILCVGKTAGNTLLNKKSSLGALRGKFNDFYGIPTMVTYHPAALLRNEQWKRPTWEDVKLLRQKYDELTG
ncbi:MAG: uracil-DNA glycosylase [Bacteroidota bacterium]